DHKSPRETQRNAQRIEITLLCDLGDTAKGSFPEINACRITTDDQRWIWGSAGALIAFQMRFKDDVTDIVDGRILRVVERRSIRSSVSGNNHLAKLSRRVGCKNALAEYCYRKPGGTRDDASKVDVAGIFIFLVLLDGFRL